MTLKRQFYFLLYIMMCGCTSKVTSYEPEGKTQWVVLDRDSAKYVTFFVHVSNEMPTAVAEIDSKFGSLSYFESVDIYFEGLDQDTTRLDILISKENGLTEDYSFTGKDWSSVMHRVMVIENLDDTVNLSLSCQRPYRIKKLPQKLRLHYSIKTEDGFTDGAIPFVARETETPGVMRWH